MSTEQRTSKTVTPDSLRALTDDDSVSRHVLKLAVLQAAAHIETLQAEATDLKEQRRNLQHDLMMVRLERPTPYHSDPTGKTRESPHCPSCSCGMPAVETSDALTVPLKVYDALKVDRDDWRQREHALRAALQKIVDEGDYTAPEGMKRIAQDALISAEEPKVTLEPITDCMLCNRPFTEHTRVCPEKASGEQP